MSVRGLPTEEHVDSDVRVGATLGGGRRLRGSGSIPLRGAPTEPRPRAKRETFVPAAPSGPMTPVVEAWRTRGTRGGSTVVGARRRRVMASSPVPRARELTAWTCGPDRVSAAAFDSSRTRACLSSRRALISPTRPAIIGPARHAPLRDLPPRDSTTPYPTMSPKSPTGSNSEPQPGHKSPIG